MESALFRARLFINEGELTEITVWDDELTPNKPGKRSIRDWVEEHFQGSCSVMDLFDGLTEEGHYEVVMEGRITSKYCEITHEYDEEVEVLSFKKQDIPYDPEWDEPISIELPQEGKPN